MSAANDWIQADWPAPPRVRTLITTRNGGVSAPPYASLNLGTHVEDDPARVAENRALLRSHLPAEPVWLNQVHGIAVCRADTASGVPDADASVTRQAETVCSIMTADCLPVLLCDGTGSVVAAAHAGWRGLCNGVLEATIAAMDTDPTGLMAWMGPAIGPDAFEVGAEVRAAFIAHNPASDAAFSPIGDDKYLADIYLLASLRLQAAGIRSIHGGGRCTVIERDQFFSYRRDGRTGRMASLIWLED
jgi:YfiH family protein